MEHKVKTKRYLIFIIVLAEFAGTSLWFGTNAVLKDISLALNIDITDFGYITSSVQLGFIAGTLVYAILGLADRISPSILFFISALLASIANLGIVIISDTLISLLILRFICGFFLAGIYPVGMKIAADWYAKDLGKALGFLVGALVLGTSFPHLLASLKGGLPWQYVIYGTSGIAVIGGLAIALFVPDGPYRSPGKKFNLSGFSVLVKNIPLRRAAIAYFGHMWELYTFWAFVPILLLANGIDENYISVTSFFIIASGSISCIVGGYIARKAGSEKVALFSLILSCLCCLIYPLVFNLDSTFVIILFLTVWGLAVIADSPQLSSIVAKHGPKENLGSTLTLVNCIGFTITIFSIQLINSLILTDVKEYAYMILAIGPILGIVALYKLSYIKALK